jgi:hypothetical protein
MEDRVADGLVAVAGATIYQLVRMPRSRHDLLGVEVVSVVVVRVEQPLLVMQVEDVLFECTGVGVANLRLIAEVRMVDVRRIFLE